jgi:Basic region leucine zipper
MRDAEVPCEAEDGGGALRRNEGLGVANHDRRESSKPKASVEQGRGEREQMRRATSQSRACRSLAHFTSPGHETSQDVVQLTTARAASSDWTPAPSTPARPGVVDEEARQRRMLRNRESAARSRERRTLENADLEMKIAKLKEKSEHIQVLHSELTRLLGCMKAEVKGGSS